MTFKKLVTEDPSLFVMGVTSTLGLIYAIWMLITKGVLPTAFNMFGIVLIVYSLGIFGMSLYYIWKKPSKSEFMYLGIGLGLAFGLAGTVTGIMTLFGFPIPLYLYLIVAIIYAVAIGGTVKDIVD